MMTDITELTFTANGFIPFTNYTFRVAGVNSAGTGVYSNIITFTTNDESKHVATSLSLFYWYINNTYSHTQNFKIGGRA